MSAIAYFADSSRKEADKIALQLIYADEYGKENYYFFRNNIDFSFGSWEKDLRDIIDDDCQSDFTLETNNEKKAEIVAKFLTKKNDIITYKKFIAVWKKYGGARADQFEQKLKRRLEKAGLTHVDNHFQLNS